MSVVNAIISISRYGMLVSVSSEIIANICERKTHMNISILSFMQT